MDDTDSLTRLQGLQADLLAFSESRFPNVERLWAELEVSIDDFRKLLDKQQKNDKSRRDIQGEKVTIDEAEYVINDEFRQEAIQVAEELDLDELEAARLVLESQDENTELDRPTYIGATIRFHQYREALLDALRQILACACDVDVDAQDREMLNRAVSIILHGEADRPPPKSTFWRRCLQGMEEIEAWIGRLRDRLASMQVIGETAAFAHVLLTFQRGSLVRQHENLAMILRSLVNLGHTTIDDYKHLTTKLVPLENFDEIIVHYLPVLIEFPSVFGAEGQASLRDARSMDQTFSDTTDATRWRKPDFKAAASVFWLAEYSGRYMEGITGSPLQNVDLKKENKSRSDRVMNALKDGAFQFLLLVCSKIKPQLWYDPAKTGLVQFLLGDSRIESQATMVISLSFVTLLADQLQIFVESLISNMPDTIRQLKSEEDDQRRNLILSHGEQEPTLHLERFMTIIAYAYEGSSITSLETFWADSESNMYGFLQWASKRQSTPRAAAFCEMFRSIAEDEKCADKAHSFLLEESVGASSAKLRRGTSLSWAQIFSELSYYAERFRESPNALVGYGEGPAAQISEPESALMLECYLRLTAHMCRSSVKARAFLLGNADFRLHEVLFDLCRSGIESRFKASAYYALASLLTEKTIETSHGMWATFDEWICGVSGGRSGPPRPSPAQPASESAMFARLRPIATGFEESNAFIRFLQTLIELPVDQQELSDALPFPEQLGVNYRMAGIDQYIDFVFGSVMTGVLPNLEDQSQIWQLRCACLDFIQAALSSFNEDLVIFANSVSIDVDEAITTSTLVQYVKLHPFARVMEWVFNDAVITQLFAASHADPDFLASDKPDSPVVTSVARSVQVINHIMRLQATYFDIVRPVIKTQAAVRSRQVANPTLASFEDAILANLSLVVDLGLYCSTSYEHLTSLSLDLLQRLAQSRKLTGPSAGFSEGRSQPSRLLAALQQANDVDRITASFIAPLQIESRELEMGTESPGYGIKLAILDLLNRSLDSSGSRPGLAHCLLGFQCTERTISIATEGRFSRGQSLFHAIARLYAETATPEPIQPSLALIRGKASEMLRKLYRSPLTSEVILSELRESGFNEVVAVSQTPVLETFPVELLADNIGFLNSELATVFCNTIAERGAYFEHQALELRSAARMQSTTMQERTRSSVLGTTHMSTGEQAQHSNVFDLFDFYDELLIQIPDRPPTHYFKDVDFDVCYDYDESGAYIARERLVKELILLRIADLRQQGELGPLDAPVEENEHLLACHAEADDLNSCIRAANKAVQIKEAQKSACKAWVQLITIMLTCGNLEGVQKTTFIVKALEVILPKIDFALETQHLFLLPFAKLLHALTHHSMTATAPVPTDRLTAALRTSLNLITQTPDATAPDLREIGYQTASLLLTVPSAPLARSARVAIEAAGTRLLETATDDVLASSPSLRLSALLLLSSCVDLFAAQNSPAMVRQLARLNFISTLVDGIRAIPATFAQERPKSELEGLLKYIRSCLALLLRVAKDNEGAAKVLEAGLFSAVRESGLFSADPELGGEMVESEEALVTFYSLLGNVLRVVAAVVTVKGERNEGVCAAGRGFLGESRGCLLAVLKAGRKGGEVKEGLRAVLGEVLDGFMVVVWGTGFLDVSIKRAVGDGHGADFLQFDDNPTKAAKGRMGLAFT